MQASQLPEFGSLNQVHVLVVGDVMLDRYWLGAADRVSPEAPVPVLDVESIEEYPGGAANVALNIVSLGARCTLIGYVGDDEAAQTLTTTLEAAGVECDFLPVADWSTIVKLRLVAQQQQLMRADFESLPPVIGTSERQALLLNKVEKHLQHSQVVVLEDYDKGVLDEPQALIAAAQRAGVPSVVDPKHKDLAQYAGATVIKPNEKEFRHAVGGKGDASAAQALCKELNISGMVVTRGGDGMDVCDAESARHVPARPVDVYDVTGAGDTTAATLALGLGCGWSLLDAARVANVAASIAVSKSGTTAVTGPELARALTGRGDGGMLSRADLAQEVAAAKAQGQRVVFTNGCFDILHAGHVTYLEEAAALGDRLIVAINDDASVTALKGAGRPIVPQEGRARVLLGLGCVDWVVIFSEATPEPLLELLKPDVLVKGGDYTEEQVVGAEIVQSYGGSVQVLSMVADVSTTRIVERIKSNS
ncbi:MAG: bifunctional D-glycero-beta-D-manno-heptose-7-phosphate kinase/D-glycero-beta-D-manno-heptose 1-phosphate adenylyltransferase HldE [Pseudomonadales bacterium]